jgi:integrase
MSVAINITKRERRRKLQSGAAVVQTRYVLNYRDPRTGNRRQLFYERQKDAQRKASQIQAEVTRGTYEPARKPLTIKEAVDAWLSDRYAALLIRAVPLSWTLRKLHHVS